MAWEGGAHRLGPCSTLLVRISDGRACSSLSPREPPLGQIIALNMIYYIILVRGGREHSAVTPGVNKLIGLDMANQILRMRLSAGSRTEIVLNHISRCHQPMQGCKDFS